MIRVRKLERRGENGDWHSDAYALETSGGQISLRYSLAWEYLGGRYNRMIQEQKLSLEQLEQVLVGDNLRWLPVETLEMNDEDGIEALDRECHVPRPVTISADQQAGQSARTEPIILKAHIVSGHLQLSAPMSSPIRVQGNRIYLKDGCELQIALAPAPRAEAQPG